jgi:Fic family protein
MKKDLKFTHQDLKLPNPKWDSPIVNILVELETLRNKSLDTRSIDLFVDLKFLFHKLENWASARIEGNQTELIDALDPAVKKKVSETADYQELKNLEEAIDFIDDYCKEHKEISKAFILEVHKLVTQNLPVGPKLPGDRTPGRLRLENVKISESQHLPPIGAKVPEYIEELVSFANAIHDKKYAVLKVAVAHHRFTWIHPFTNGNGRVTRLLTYAMLQILGYGVNRAHILNPSIIFSSNRELYYKQLASADKGTESGLLSWSYYFAQGLLEEVNKIDRLLDGDYVKNNLLLPVLRAAYAEKRISEREYLILRHSFNNDDFTFVSGDVSVALGEKKSSVVRSTIVKKMRESELITTAFKAKQRYIIKIDSPILIRNMTKTLYDEGFVHSAKNEVGAEESRRIGAATSLSLD